MSSIQISKPNSCDCTEKLEKIMRDQEAELGFYNHSFSHLTLGGKPIVWVDREKINKKKNTYVKAKQTFIVATFCPFCGVKYE